MNGKMGTRRRSVGFSFQVQFVKLNYLQKVEQIKGLQQELQKGKYNN